MRNPFMIALVGLALLATSGTSLLGAADDPETIINHTKQIVMTPNSPENGLTKALGDVLGASLVILPQTEYAAEFKARVEVAKKSFAEGSLFSEKAYQDLGAAYKLVSRGQAWQVPVEIKAPGHGSIEDAKRICLKLLDSALAEYKSGQNVEAVRDLVSFVLLVVTPIER